MCIQTNTTLIISLIKDDLINSKLVYGLSAIGLNASDFHLHLSTIILQLMGFKDDAYGGQLYERYQQLAQKAKHLNIGEANNGLNDLAHEIYSLLMQHAPNQTDGFFKANS
jgi:hypothetical protein